MTDTANDTLTDEVVARFADTPDPRLREILSSLVRHLHAFAREVQLTEDEWFRGIDFLTRTGHQCSGTRQEFILLSDVLGLSMQTVAINAPSQPGCTESTVFGPFHVPDAPKLDLGADIAQGARGTPCTVRGRVLGPQGEPVPHASIDVWQADDDGLYDVQREHLPHAQARAVLQARADGSFEFRSILPQPYPIPTDGPVGELLRATRRSAIRPAHLHFMVQAPGWRRLITHVFRRGDPQLGSDPVFGVKPSLVADWVEQSDGTALLEFDFVLQPQEGGNA
ncbi:MAG: hydroxyquinol 1,2-dioxygenase [Piscinibacter sp.]|uniref:dioxygenase family protein n=1 Tax=Piscinibacter sp. TaxID=1903157 RepID=UPI0025855381|nr:dioxygenase [Piscinibacter sp.]MCW5666360.1 hydroxyquinol 1,2-dioxygenase [Piscinibacter sp.]